MKANGSQDAPIDVVRMANGGLTAVDKYKAGAHGVSKTPVQVSIHGLRTRFLLPERPVTFREQRGVKPS
jgi:hypothetical protein